MKNNKRKPAGKKRPTQKEETYSDDMKGVLFKNTRKRKGKKDPSLTGHVTIDGQKYWVNGWPGESSQGNWYCSLKLQEAETEESEEDDDDLEEDDENFLPQKKKSSKGKKRKDEDEDEDEEDDLPF